MEIFKYPEGIYSKDISYVNPFSLYQFFSNQDETAAFVKYLRKRIVVEHKKRKEEYSFGVLFNNDNDDHPTLEIEYNFLILVLADWVSHFSSNDFVEYEIKKFHTFEEKRVVKSKESDNEEIDKIRKHKTLKFHATVKEKVLHDYAFDSWLMQNKFKKDSRKNFFYGFLSNMIHANLVWINYRSKYKTLITPILLKDVKYDKHVLVNYVSLSRKSLAKNLNKKMMDDLKLIAQEYEPFFLQSGKVKDKIDELNDEGFEVKSYQSFDVESFEKERDFGNKQWVYVSKNDEENKSENDENS